VAVSISPFTGQQQVQDWQASFIGRRLFRCPRSRMPQAQSWIAF